MSGLQNNKPNPIRLVFSGDGQSIVIAFCSLRLESDVPPFEWAGVLINLPAKKIYVRDLYRRWYLRGLPGIAVSLEAVESHLRHYIDIQKCSRAITIGTSMGGYAALLIGHLLGVVEVHAFSPQLFLPSRQGRSLAKAILRRNWPLLWNQEKFQLHHTINRCYLILRRLIENDNGNTNYHVYYSGEYSVDVVHANQLEEIEGIILHKRHDEGHIISVSMRNSGKLEKILLDTIDIQHKEETIQ